MKVEYLFENHSTKCKHPESVYFNSTQIMLNVLGMGGSVETRVGLDFDTIQNRILKLNF